MIHAAAASRCSIFIGCTAAADSTGRHMKDARTYSRYAAAVCYANLTFSGGTITGNTATSNGGGICVERGTLEIVPPDILVVVLMAAYTAPAHFAAVL